MHSPRGPRSFFRSPGRGLLLSIACASLFLPGLASFASGSHAASEAAAGRGLAAVDAPASAVRPAATTPYGNISLAAVLPNATLPPGSDIEANYSFHLTSFPGGTPSITVYMPGELVTFALSGGGSLSLWIQPHNFTVTGTGAQGGSTTVGHVVVGSSGAAFAAGAKAVMTSQILSVMYSVPWGTAKLWVEWTWGAYSAGGGTLLASGTSRNTTLVPHEFVSVLSDGPAHISPGENFTVCVGGPTIANQSLSLHMEIPNPYYAFAWNTTHVPGNDTTSWCWSVQMPIWFHELPTALVVHIWSYATLPGILYVLHTQGVVSTTGTIRGHVSPPYALVNLSGLPISVSPSGEFDQLADVGTYYLVGSARGWVTSGEWVSIRNNSVTWANLSLTGHPGTLSGTVRPSDANVTVNGSAIAVDQGHFSVPLAPGSYPVGASLPGYRTFNATVLIQPGGTVTLTIVLQRGSDFSGKYPVWFNATGLPAGTSWQVQVAMETYASSGGPTIALSLPNGSYPVMVPPIGNLVPTPTMLTLSVAGAPVTVAVNFVATHPAPPTYRITFLASGLGGGPTWSVDMAGSTYSSPNGGAIVVNAQNGSYAYTVPTVDGAAPTPGQGNVEVHGAAQVVVITFVLPPPAAPKGGSGAAFPWAPVAIALAGLGGAVVTAAALLRHRRHGSGSPAPAGPTGRLG